MNSSKDIEALCNDGCLDSVSIIPNMSSFDKVCSSVVRGVKCSIHLNFMEGWCCSPKEGLTDLVDERGFFKASWLKLMLASYNPFKRAAIRSQLSREIVAQIEKCIEAGIVDSRTIRLDSHQHTHMIPVVADALFDAVSKLSAKGMKFEYIRNTEDPISIYMRTPGALEGFSFANLLKCLILNFYSIGFKRRLHSIGLQASYLCGVFYSGCMEPKRLGLVLPAFKKLAEKKGREVEVLFHPGSVKADEISEEFVKPGFVEFHLSPNRHIEYESIRNLKERDL